MDAFITSFMAFAVLPIVVCMALASCASDKPYKPREPGCPMGTSLIVERNPGGEITAFCAEFVVIQ